ncbi:MAG: TonB-dependent receptor [Agarilytica sp.]
MRPLFFILSFILISIFSSPQLVMAGELEEVYVTAELFEKRLMDSSTSVMVLNEEVLRSRQAQQLEDVINMIPNFNYSSGASRGKYFQVRGTGERSEFLEPLSPSVGVVIDGIDFTGVAGAASMLDVKQLEVLRGPQGTLNGANALAGLVTMVSKAPEDDSGEAKINLGNYGKREFTQSISGKATESLGLRVAASSVQSDGFIKNTHLDRDDTNNIDEKTLKARASWKANENLNVNFTGIIFDADNGYDAFTLDNSRNTLSDEPGEDSNLTNAVSLVFDYKLENMLWQSTMSSLNSESVYSYDVDWTYRTICEIDDPCAFWQYSHFDEYNREKDNLVIDSRVIQQSLDHYSYVFGVYYRDETSKLDRIYTDNDPNYSTFYGPITEQVSSRYSSEYDTQNVALYSQWEIPLGTDNLVLNAGLRAETRDFDYETSANESRSASENFWGGKLALEFHGYENQLAYALLSRGYKAGGANVPSVSVGPATDLIPELFDPEYLWNFELGHKAQWWNNKLTTNLVLFYQERDNIQIRQSLVTSQSDGELNGVCPCDFTDYTDNVDSAANYGLELEVRAQVNDSVSAWLFASGLSADYQDFESNSHTLADPVTGTAYDLSGRDQAHAPNYQASLGVDVAIVPGLDFQISGDAKSNFYLSSRHNETTESYILLNSHLTYTLKQLEFTLWGKNLTDEDVVVRGFGSFGNDPRDFYVGRGPYYQYGNPRQLGVSAGINF